MSNCVFDKDDTVVLGDGCTKAVATPMERAKHRETYKNRIILIE